MTDARAPELGRTLLGVLALLLLIGATAWILVPFVPAILWACTIVVATWPMLRGLERRLGGRRAMAAALMTLGLALTFFLPLVIAVEAIYAQSTHLVEVVQALRGRPLPPPPAWVAALPVVGARIAAQWQELVAGGPDALLARVTPYSGEAVRWVASHAGSLGRVVVDLLLTVVIAGVLYASGDSAAGTLRAVVRRLAGARGESALALSANAIRGVALGVVVTAVVQAILGGLGLLVAGVPGALVLTAVMFFLAVIHVGAILPLLIGVAWLFSTGAKGAAIALLVWSIAVAALDNILRPWLIRRGADLPLLLIVAGVLGGLFAFGLVGLFLGPVVLAVTHTLLEAWVQEAPPSVEEAPPLPS